MDHFATYLTTLKFAHGFDVVDQQIGKGATEEEAVDIKKSPVGAEDLNEETRYE